MKDLTDITIVLDRSGSMEAVRADTIGGFNVFLEEQQAVADEATLTLVQFNTVIETLYAQIPLAEAHPLTPKTFVPGGGTALLDAIGMTINATGARLAALPEQDRPERVLLVVMTDGEENSSHSYSREQVFAMISHQREHYSWQIAFIGANQDAITTGASLGIPTSNAMSYVASPSGTRDALDKMNKATASLRRRKSRETDKFFDEDTEEAAAQAGAQSSGAHP